MISRTGAFLSSAVFALASLPALPVLAQDAAMCGGVGANGMWVGGSAETSDISTSASHIDQTGVMVPPGGETVSLFSVSTPGEYRIEASPNPGGDTVIDIRDEAGTIILTDDDSGGDLASRGDIFLQPGTYCVSTRAFGGGAVVADLRVGRAEHEALTPGWGGGFGNFAGVDPCLPNTPATQLGSGVIDAELQAGVTATNSIAATPYYRFSLSAPQALTIRAENQSADPYIYIYDGQGTLIAENDDYESLNSRIDFTDPLPAGNYCIAMRSLSDDTQPVTVSVRGYDPVAAMQEMFATGEASPPIGGSYPIIDLGPLQTSLVMDQVVGSDAVWFSFTVPAGGLVVIDAIEISDSDPVIRLFDGVGRFIEFNDDAGGSLNSQLTTRVNPGTYMLGVTQYSESYSGVIRVALQRYVPAQ
ncbi:ABC transporter substrate-binding protein [Roseobacter sp. HKCCD9010]|uniref:DVUA0089 family protein n=1 Tax=unclassified Roseobacter TaxID=196798 RepID=UPI001490B2B9|nr:MULTISPECIES: DVUA0089 family protein [unclassified Roseobacter]MBF9050688.1 ABC transporter substrate-binding protein [Rhodobacterales bacterium HKCCD4356]NNV11894.1 ABC transporter substrate-binding protein [Roseobacter sp. HKCCD7357]NNV18045.1 ABC transporter substrate-binding protein [Roseobacter sp. HKCCD8768]NNV26136.1 ABC transporter substrate-binding protein [Roseobacter sp. HKCCD8192]NNV31772.1 ABC transporter substrate-binding protein [Roseobacter sp. HKCCD9061]